MQVLRGTLTAVLNPDQVDKALAAAQRQPLAKKMFAAAEAASRALKKGGGGGGGGAGGGAGGSGGGPKAVRSTYQAFTTVAMAHLKAHDRAELASMTTVGNTWKRLPAGVRERIEARLTELK